MIRKRGFFIPFNVNKRIGFNLNLHYNAAAQARVLTAHAGGLNFPTNLFVQFEALKNLAITNERIQSPHRRGYASRIIMLSSPESDTTSFLTVST